MTTTDFPCCETRALSDREVIALGIEARARTHRWIAPKLLDHYPDGPYAVHAYYPASRRELVTRNHTADSAVAEAERQQAAGSARDVHVSLDTCG